MSVSAISDAPTVQSPLTSLRAVLVEARAHGVDFDTAWADALRTARPALETRADAGESVYDFARARFERAYYGIDPSVPMCQIDGCREASPCPRHPRRRAAP